jgi:glycosyltransferase involved in cell wall biosynthesis
MRVVHLLNNFDFGGAESLLFDLGECAAGENLDWSFLLIKDSNSETNKKRILLLRKYGLKVISALNFFSATLALMKEGKKKKIDIVHAHNLKSLICACFFKCFFVNVKLVFTQHTSYLKRPHFHYLIGRLVNAYIAICLPAKASMIKNGISERKVNLICNGAAIKNKRKFFLNFDNAYNLLVVGRMVKEKNHGLLVDAVSMTVKENPEIDFKVWFFGDGPMKGFIEDKILDRGLSKYFYLLGNVESAKEYFHNFDLFLMTSDIEGMPVSALEALASEVPVLATDAGGLSEIVNVGVEGLIVPVGNTEEFSRALSYMLSGNKLKEYKNNLGQKSQKFGIDAVLADHLELYGSLGG